MAYGLTQSADLESGSSQYFSRADNALLQASNALTIEGWFKVESQPGTDTRYSLCTKWDNSGGQNQRSYTFYYRDNASTKQLTLGLSGDGSSSEEENVNWEATLDTWYHLAVTYDGSAGEVKFYVNGSQQGATQATAVASLFDNDAPFAIGAVNPDSPALYFDGRVSLVRMWKTVRSGTDIANNICEVLGSTTNLSGEWTLDNTLNDNSGNSLTLTNNNTATFGSDVPSTCSAPATSVNLLTLLGVS